MSDTLLVDILVPNLPESVADATVAIWHKKIGDKVEQNEVLLEIETDKIMLDIPSPDNGILESIVEQEGSIVLSGQVLGRLRYSKSVTKNIIKHDKHDDMFDNVTLLQQNFNDKKKNRDEFDILITPSARKLIAAHNLKIDQIKSNDIKKKRITRQDVELYINQCKKVILHDDIKDDMGCILNNNQDKNIAIEKNKSNKATRVVMNRLRKRISERLLAVTNSTAMLTTFNEVNMKPIMKLRKKYGDLFETRHKIKLGLMSFYVKSVLEGLRRFPEINASIDGEEIVYYNYFDISIAVSTTRGLVTPVLKNVDSLSIPDIEKNIKSLAEKSRLGKLTIEELNGGNFTITNGGIFGSLMSTPIINPPQSAILGMHVIKERPVAVDGQVVILPMMYLALSYDHRLIDGKDSVRFLVCIKELLEDPIRLLLDV